MTTIRKILAPTDFSDISLRAAAEAVQLAAQVGAAVHLLHVCPLLMYALEPGVVPDDPEFEQRLKKRLEERLEQSAAQLRNRGAEVHTRLVDGNPGQVIAEIAGKDGFDLVVMATHGRTGLPRLMMGSVAERTVRTCPVPVLAWRPPSDA